MGAAAFLALNPRLWHDPAARLADMLLFHVRYSQGYNVQRSGYPWYQPFVWLSRPAPWHPNVFFYGGLDGIVFWLALAGAFLERRARPWVTIWLVGGMAVLLLWPTKWPQYTLVLAPPLCLAAAAALRTIWAFVRDWEDRWNLFRNIFPAPPRYSGSCWARACLPLLGRDGRQLLSQRDRRRCRGRTLRPSRRRCRATPFNEILALGDGRMALGTDKGLALWTPQEATDVPDRWDVFTASSGLAGDDVQALAEDPAGRLWVGGAGGLARYDGRAGRPSGHPRPACAATGSMRSASTARAVCGSARTAARPLLMAHAGQSTRRVTRGLANDYVLALALERSPSGDVVWFGLMDGISRLDTASGEWTTIPPRPRLGPGRRRHAVRRCGRPAVGGLARRRPQPLGRQPVDEPRTAGSGLPNYTVQTIFETAPGNMWIGTGLPLTAGGTLSAYDGQVWRNYTDASSGYSGAEPLALATDRRAGCGWARRRPAWTFCAWNARRAAGCTWG